jgi:hypothetical protein
MFTLGKSSDLLQVFKKQLSICPQQLFLTYYHSDMSYCTDFKLALTKMLLSSLLSDW